MMAELTSRQYTELAALRRALSEGDYDMAAVSLEILQGLETPLLVLLDTLGENIWDDEDMGDGDIEIMLDQFFQNLDESAIPALAAYIMEEEGPDLLLDLAAERLEAYDADEVLQSLKKALHHPDERIREGVHDYLAELSADSEEAEDFLSEYEDTE